MTTPDIGYLKGDVVLCYEGSSCPVYGVVVAEPTKEYPRYRVRVSTNGPHDYVELGVRRVELKLVSRHE